MKNILKILLHFISYFFIFIIILAFLDFISFLINLSILNVEFNIRIFFVRLLSILKYIFLPAGIFSLILSFVNMKEKNRDKKSYVLFILFFSTIFLIFFFWLYFQINFEYFNNGFSSKQLKLINSNYMLLNVDSSFEEIKFLIPDSFFVMKIIFNNILNINFQFYILSSFKEYYFIALYIFSVMMITISLKKLINISVWKLANLSLAICIFIFIFLITTILPQFILNYNFDNSIIISKIHKFIPIILNFILSVVFLFLTRKIGRKDEF